MDAVLDLAESLMSSPWLLALIIALTLFDSVVPILPAETVVITAGAYAATGSPDALLVILAAWCGAIIGDLLAHQLGRGAGPLTGRMRRRGPSRALLHWAEHGLQRRGGLLIIAARFIPGGRTATSITSGAVGYPRWRFLVFCTIASLAWAVYSTGIGMAGGLAFRDQPLVGVAIGVGLALSVGAAIELVRRRRTVHAAAGAVATGRAGLTHPGIDRRTVPGSSRWWCGSRGRNGPGRRTPAPLRHRPGALPSHAGGRPPRAGAGAESARQG